MNFEEYEITECECEICKNLCLGRVCWGTTTDVEKLILAGYANRLMLDYWADCEGGHDIYFPVPAMVGYEGRPAPYWPQGRCTFFTREGKCEIHHLKPIEGKIAHHSLDLSRGSEIHKGVAMSWDTPKAQELRRYWQDKVGCYDLPPDTETAYQNVLKMIKRVQDERDDR